MGVDANVARPDTSTAAQPKTAAAHQHKHSIEGVLEGFVQEIDSLAATLPLVMVLVDSGTKTAHEEFLKYAKDHCTEEKNERGAILFRIPPDIYQEYSNKKRKFQTIRLAQKTIPRSFLTSLVSHYDAFLGALLRAVFFMRPELLNSSEKSFTFKDLTEIGSVEQAREYIVEKEVESVIRESHEKQFDWMEARFKLQLRKDLPSWSKFIEVTERRNLFVHCNGIVSSQYLGVCRKHDVNISGCSVGEELHVKRQYFESAYEVVFEIGVKLAHVLWRKMRPDEREDSDWNLNEISLNLIRDQNYSLAKVLLDFACSQKQFGSEYVRRTLILNRAQAYKWSGDTVGMNRILKEEDWSASNEKFQLALAVLNDKFSEAAGLMRRVGSDPTGSPNKGDYKEWPIFKQFRRSKEFGAAYNELFNEPYLESRTSPEGDDVAIDKKIEDVAVLDSGTH